MLIHHITGNPTSIQHGDEVLVERAGNGGISYLKIFRENHPLLSISRDTGITRVGLELPVAPKRVEAVLIFAGTCCGLEVKLDNATGRFIFQTPPPA